MRKLIVIGLLLFGSIVFAQNQTEFFCIDLYGNTCDGGLFEFTQQGLDNHVKILLINGPQLTREQYYRKLSAVRIRQYYFHQLLKKNNAKIQRKKS